MKKLPPILSSDSENHPKTMLRNTASLLVLWLCLASAVAQASGPYQNELRAAVITNTKFIELPKPLYFSDFYPGAWKLKDENGVQHTPDEVFWYKPVNQSGNPFHIGNYSPSNYGAYSTVRRRLKIQKDYGIYPAIQIMERHHIAYNSSTGKYYLQDWNDMGVVKSGFSGASDNGTAYHGANVYDKVYKPVLNELKLPHIVQIDMWQFESEAYKLYPNIPTDTFKRLWWEEFTWQMNRIFPNGSNNPSDYLVKFLGYGSSTWMPGVAIYGNVSRAEPYPNHCSTNGVDSLAVQFLKAAGGGGWSGNPYTGENLNLFVKFWLNINGTFNPNYRTCPNLGTSVGLQNQVNVRAEARPADVIWNEYLNADSWMESLDNVGPRFFYGFFPRFKTNRSIYYPNSLTCKPNVECRDYTFYNTAIGEKFLNDPVPVGKGMIFLAHSDLAESGAMEPVMLAGSPQDPVNLWVNNRPAQLDWFWNKKIPVTLPWQLQ